MYLGHAYLFGRSNLIDAHLGLDFHLTKDITMYAAEHVYWRQNTNDGLYNLSGAVIAPTTAPTPISSAMNSTSP